MNIVKRLLVIMLLLATSSCAFADPCGNKVISDARSPDGRMTAIVFERDCGATTDFSTQVSILAADDPLVTAPTLLRSTKSGNVFVADTDDGTAPAGAGGGPVVEVAWLGPKRVRIAHDARARVFRAE